MVFPKPNHGPYMFHIEFPYQLSKMEIENKNNDFLGFTMFALDQLHCTKTW